MHYRDGTPAMIGDVVKGKGYNLRDGGGQLREFVGTVVGLTPGSDACNIQVAHVATHPVAKGVYHEIVKLWKHIERKGVIGCGSNGGDSAEQVFATADIEYGQCDHFDLVHRAA